jgi:hypothetical protein
LEDDLDLKHYASARPYLYHLTHRANVAHLREMRRLIPAATLLRLAGRLDLLRTPRRSSIAVVVEGRTVVLRDQKPLHKGNIRLPNGFRFEDFVESLNQRIFFWPGGATRPIPHGLRHFEHYKAENPAILRIDLNALLELNPTAVPRFCHYNSGSPRCSHGKKSPRSPRTFLIQSDFGETASKVVEVTFETEIQLPQTTELGSSPRGRWRTL